MKFTLPLFVLCLLLATPWSASAGYEGWKHSGTMHLLTTPEGADLPAGALVKDFPLLVRLQKDFFDFTQARPDGADLRFASAAGEPLAFQVEEWDPSRGVASVWVRVPLIQGNATQEIKLHWGKPDAAAESDGAKVFNAGNGYLSVWHMDPSVKDSTGILESKDVGTTATTGMVGPARHLAGKQGVFCGDKIANYPTGSASHSSQAWFRAEQVNGRVLGWGNEHAQGKVIMHYRSPPHLRMECYFSGADVASAGKVPTGEWVHVVHTYEKGDSRVYINGVLDGVTKTANAPLAIKSPARLWIGGWYNSYDFVGDIDEVRVSNVVRSADWVKLEHANQKPMQSLVGHLVQPGDAFGVTPTAVTLMEGKSATITAQAGGARKVYWILKRDGRESVAATDRLNLTFDAGRVTGDQSATLFVKAIYANEVKSREIPITIKEAVAEPAFTLSAPAAWDGRARIEVVPQVANLEEMKAQGAGELRFAWSAGDFAVTQEQAGGKLVLTRAQNSGKLRVTATIDNGGRPTSQSVEIAVTEPARDSWVARVPGKDERPEDHQFIARDDTGLGTLHCNGTLDQPADTVVLRVYADEKLIDTQTLKPAADRSYAFAAKLKAGLVKYRVELAAQVGEQEKVLHTAKDIVCGDAYLINGQSNAVATDFGKEEPAFRSEWIRSFGSTSGSPKGVRVWGDAAHRGRDGTLAVGYWGMELGRRLVEGQKVPVCLINGAVGGTRIDQHQRHHADPEDMTTIYGRLLWRVRQSRLTHGVRGVIWHQGENDQGADGPTGGYGWETYRRHFIEMAAAWKQDYPNLQHYHVFQIWPKSCSMGFNGSDNRLREVQRTLPTAFARMSVMSTLGIDPPGGCHFPAAGYAEFARLICPLIERDHYGKAFAAPITAPDLKRASFTNAQQDAITLEFDQPVKWDDTLTGQFQLDGEKGKIAAGSVAGNVLTLKLAGPTKATRITYLDSASWSQAKLLRGENGIAALTFCEVAMQPAGNP